MSTHTRLGFGSGFPIRLSGRSVRSEFPIRFSNRGPPVLKRYGLGIVLNAAKVYNIDEMPSAVGKVQPARSSINWEEGYDQNELEFQSLMKLQSFPGTPRVISYEREVVFWNEWCQRDTMNLLVVSKLGNHKPTYTVWFQTLVPHNHLTRHHNLGKLVAKMRRKCPQLPSNICSTTLF